MIWAMCSGPLFGLLVRFTGTGLGGDIAAMILCALWGAYHVLANVMEQ